MLHVFSLLGQNKYLDLLYILDGELTDGISDYQWICSSISSGFKIYYNDGYFI